VGVLWDRDRRLAKPLLDGLYAEGDLIVGDNEPYSGQLVGDCLWQHATCRGLINALVEIRQDLIRDAAGQEAWAQRLTRLVGAIVRATFSVDAPAGDGRRITPKPSGARSTRPSTEVGP
jgi:predicted N-formylglutamate amidohydrolase